MNAQTESRRVPVARLLWLLMSALCVALLASPAVQARAAGVMDTGSPTILITGSNRGVGLALTREYASQGWNVIATCRNPRRATELQALAKANPKIKVEALDAEDNRTIDRLARDYRGVPIDVIFNNAAQLGEPLDKQRFGQLDPELFDSVMRSNVYGPLHIAEAFVDNVAASKQKKIIGMTSGMGSLTLMGSRALFYYYQISKAALNMGFRALRSDLKGRGITVALLAPGMVGTDMLAASGYKGKALTPAESAASLYKLVAAVTPEDKGVPVNVDGAVLPW
jgi:NAD(P)-dependent dehydrogenase (short-subunit alcohol dehydrogenase family)